LFLAFVFFVVSPASAQPAVIGTVSNITRVESWSYFQPQVDPLALTPAPIGDPDYTFFGDRAELGVAVKGTRFDLSGQFNYVRLESLPQDAIGPGGLGTGAFYFAASGVRYSYWPYLSELTARTKFDNDRSSITVGRMGFLRREENFTVKRIARSAQERAAAFASDWQLRVVALSTPL
jgi:hypothetical protein